MFGRWGRYVPVSQRRRQAELERDRQAKIGESASPVILTGRTIARTPWGTAWCAAIESFSDYGNRLPRGRTYVRNGSVIDLQITPGQVVAHVSGSRIYRTTITVAPIAGPVWQKIVRDCAGAIDSLVELLQGRFSKAVMLRMCREKDGLFPESRQIRFDCSCPDGAYMCKHVAAVLYGVGARLDAQPELLFILRQVNVADLLVNAGTRVETSPAEGERVLAEDDLSALFGLELDPGTVPDEPPPPVKTAAREAPAPKAPAKAPTRVSPSEPAPAPAKAPTPAPAKAPTPAPAKAPAAAPAKAPARSAKRGRRYPLVELLEALNEAGWIDNARGRAATGLDEYDVRRLLKQLVADGHARVEGERRSTRYVAVGQPRKN